VRIGFLLIILSVIIPFCSSFAQETVDVKRSEIIEEYDGKKFYIHLIQPGQTLYSIAKVYGVSIEEIELENPQVAEGLKVNQVLKVPVVQSSMLSENKNIHQQQPVAQDDTLKGFIYHTVIPGETLYRLTKDFDVTVNQLTELNPELTDGLKAGQVLMIPEKKEISMDMIEIKKDTVVYYIMHKVRKKETLYSLSRQYDVSIDDLFLLNPVLEQGLKKKQEIKIPVSDIQAYEDVKSGVLILFSYKLPEVEETIIEEKPDCIGYRYNHEPVDVALLLPLYLEDVYDYYSYDTVSLHSHKQYKAFRFIQFYEGALLAVDSLKKLGLNIRLHVHDVDGNEGTYKTESLLLNPEMKQMDLIIGPLYHKSFALAADFAQINGIPIINPFSRRENIIHDNPTVVKVQPSWEEQLGRTVEYIQASYPDANIMIVRQNQYQQKPALNIIKDSFDSLEGGETKIPHDEVYSAIIEISIHDSILLDNKILDSIIIENQVFYKEYIEDALNDTSIVKDVVKEIVFNYDSIYGIKKNASPVRKNVIFTLSKNKVFILDFITRLNNIRDLYDIVLFGYPDWEEYELELEYLVNLNLHLFSPMFIDYNDKDVKNFVAEFRKRYNCEPQPKKYAFDGFDITYYFISALYYYRDEFTSCIHGYKRKGLSTSFEFMKEDEQDGFENRFVNVFMYEDYKKIKVNK